MTSNNLKEIGTRICNRRKQLHYTQEQIADMMDVSVQMVSNLERGNKAIRIDNLIKISEILDISTDYILTGKKADMEWNTVLEQLAQLSARDYEMITMLINYCSNKESPN